MDGFTKTVCGGGTFAGVATTITRGTLARLTVTTTPVITRTTTSVFAYPKQRLHGVVARVFMRDLKKCAFLCSPLLAPSATQKMPT